MGLIRKPSELVVQTTIKVLLYGQPGIGKTTLALSAPAPLLLDFDNGVHRIDPRHQTDTLQVGSWSDMEEVLKEDLRAYKTLVIDTAGKMLDHMSSHLVKSDSKLGKRDGSLSLQGYGARKVMFSNFLKQVSIMGKHLVFVAHEKEEKDGDTKIIRPEIGGSSSADLVRELDLVGYMEAIGKNRTISFDPCEKFYGKNTCNLDPQMQIPDVSTKSNIFLQTIFENYHQALDKRKSIASEYNQLLESIDRNIEGISDADEANHFVEWMSQVEHIWDSKLQAGRRFMERVKSLGLTRQEDGTYAQGNIKQAPGKKENKQEKTDTKEPEKQTATEPESSPKKEVKRTSSIPQSSDMKVPSLF